MIKLAEDCLLFQQAGGEQFPCAAQQICVEIMGESGGNFDAEFVKHAAAAVLHYYRDELGRESVSVAEFTLALEKILRGFNLAAKEGAPNLPRVLKSDLGRLAREADEGGELFFFPRLREELREQLRSAPQMVCFQGLRDCVKRLAGASRWTTRCQSLEDRIVEFLRSCMTQDGQGSACALVVK